MLFGRKKDDAKETRKSTNFDFLGKDKRFAEIEKAAKTAENIISEDTGAVCALCRRAAEFAVRLKINDNKGLYSNLQAEMMDNPYSTYYNRMDLNGIINAWAFKQEFGNKTVRLLDAIRRIGNEATHNATHNDKTPFSEEEAKETLRKLHFVLRNLSIPYIDGDDVPEFDPRQLPCAETEEAEEGPARFIAAALNITTRASFMDCLAALPEPVGEKTRKVVSQIKKTGKLTSGHSYIENGESRYIVKIPVDMNYSIIAFAQDSVCNLLYAGENNRMEELGRRIRCEVNTDTGTFEVFESALPGMEKIKPGADKPVAATEKPGAASAVYMFRKYDDETLIRLGIPAEYLIDVREITSMNEWVRLGERLPDGAYAALSAVIGGCSVEKAIKETYGGNRHVGKDDFRAAVSNPQVGFTNTEDDEEFERMLNAPMDKWRVFLHPQQRRIAYRHFAGAARVLGGAGTGKSVVALHHAKFLASEGGADCRILFTTFTKALTKDISDRLWSICSEEDLKKITVINLDKWVSDYVRSTLGFVVEYKEEIINRAWERAMACVPDLPGTFNAQFFAEEWEYVIQAQGIKSNAEYCEADRRGRGIRLDTKQREAVWKVAIEYNRIMQQERWYDSGRAINFCIHSLKEHTDFPRYTSVIVDECPDFGPSQFRLLRELAGEPHKDDMFLTGDPRQRIYNDRPEVVLSKCGVSVRGRSSQLLLNYRTTGSILKWANNLLNGMVFNIDEVEEENEAQPTISPVKGDEPVVSVYNNTAEEYSSVAKSIQRLLEDGQRMKDIAVIARKRTSLFEIQTQLKNLGISSDIVGSAGRPTEGIQLVTMHMCKGLEYAYVFIIGVNKGTIPLERVFAQDVPQEQKISFENSERMLLHVALTRAKTNVFISVSDKPSKFIAEMTKDS